MKFTPLANRVLIRRVAELELTPGGIAIPEMAKEKPSECIVVAIGPGGYTNSGVLVPVDLEVGDHVLITKWAGEMIKLDDVDHLVVKDGEILGVLLRDEPVARLHPGESVLGAGATA